MYTAARDIVQKIITKLDEQSCLLFLQYKMSEANQSIIKLRGYVFHPISQCNDANFLPPYLIDFWRKISMLITPHIASIFQKQHKWGNDGKTLSQSVQVPSTKAPLKT